MISSSSHHVPDKYVVSLIWWTWENNILRWHLTIEHDIIRQENWCSLSSFSISLLHFNLNRIKLFVHGLGVHENHIETIVLHWNNHCPSCCLIRQVRAFFSLFLFLFSQLTNRPILFFSLLFSRLISFFCSSIDNCLRHECLLFNCTNDDKNNFHCSSSVSSLLSDHI